MGSLVAMILLLAANGFFVGMEFALVAARSTRIEQLANEGNPRAAVALSSIRELSFMLAGAQLGITMASLGLGYVAEPAVADGLEAALGDLFESAPGLTHTIALVLALTIVVFFHMVIGEMAPKNIAIAEPDRTALWLAVPARVYANLFRPFIHVLNVVANAGVRAFGIEPRDELAAVHSAQEIGAMISESAREGALEGFKERLLSSAIELGDRDAGAAMVPRTEMKAASITATPGELESVVLETGYTRLPVYGQDLDDVIGFFHAKDLLKIPPRQRDRPFPPQMVRPMLVVPESRKLRPLLLDMRRNRAHVALVIDEHGGTAGIVTLEDVLEELVGEIRDEHDIGEMGIERLGPQRWIVPGSLRVDEAEWGLGIELPDGDYETVAGFLMDRLGRIPRRLDVVEHDGWMLQVSAMDGRRVAQILIQPAGAPTRVLP